MEAPQQPQPHTATSPPLLAQTYLGKEGDNANRLLLTPQALQVYYRAKGRAFSLEYIQYLALEHRKLWLPLIGGGILASLCFLALLHTFNMPYRLLAGGALGLLGVWWGYRGSMALVVHEQRHHTDFLIRHPAAALPVFIAFANRLIRRYPEPLGNYCIALSAAEWQQLQQARTIEIEVPRLCIPQQVAQHQRPGEGWHWAAFDPFVLGPHLQWSLQGQELLAHLKGPLQLHELAQYL